MKIEFEFDESKVVELAKATSVDDLPRAIYYEAKREAIELATKEIKLKLAEKTYYSDQERLNNEVSNSIYKSLEASIEKFVQDRLSEKNIEIIVNRLVENKLNLWVEKKVYERLEAIKADLQFYSNADLEEDRRVMEEAYSQQ